jgi:hypothetical protein
MGLISLILYKEWSEKKLNEKAIDKNNKVYFKIINSV